MDTDESTIKIFYDSESETLEKLSCLLMVTSTESHVVFDLEEVTSITLAIPRHMTFQLQQWCILKFNDVFPCSSKFHSGK